ncbi:AMP-binding protein [Kocuria sp. HSID16901]|uniref:AMP-binding protein n=1 Tax=Kocuria sp. HSID16901 TaxID=2419505 RepID=UPI00069F02F8|nr:AMP-binding protein [Kocuria sp. HSID16901]RUQ23315.1 O-succinylbenzoic acid--CoA ligase [Kocuria sp. HSID16901]
MDFTALTPLPSPSSVPETATFLDGPGSVTPVELHRNLSGWLSRETRRGEETPVLVVSTSGSTGRPKRTVLTARALRASGLATEAATGTDGGAQWLLALPVHYVAGAQVIARSVIAGTSPIHTASISSDVSFGAADFLRAAEKLTGRHRMTSLVPTQVHTLLEDADAGSVPQDELLEVLRGFNAILLGGAPASADLLARCRVEGIPLVLTYGSAETAGGCVYDAQALPGTRIAIQPSAEGGLGRIWLGGPTLASGYLGDPERTASAFRHDADGHTWYRTDDLGEVDAQGRLTVAGRADDVVITGGIKVSARAVAAELERDRDVREALVVALPSQRWGQEIRALVSRAPGRKPELEALGANVRENLGPAAVPKRILVVDHLPQTSTGKPDAGAARRALSDESLGT